MLGEAMEETSVEIVECGQHGSAVYHRRCARPRGGPDDAVASGRAATVPGPEGR